MSRSSERSVIQVQVDSNRESARVLIAQGCDQVSLTTSLLVQYARDQKVFLTPEAEQRLEEIVQDFRENPRDVDEVFIRSTPVVRGRDGCIEWKEGCNPALVEEAVDSENKEAVDFYTKQAFINVKVGEIFGEVLEPEGGEDGVDVMGTVISAIPGKALAIEIKEGIKVEGTGELRATIDGVLNLSKNILCVTRLLEISGCVDFNTGNVEFDGDVIVHDSVRDLFAVRATGNVTVNGLVEGATLVVGAI